MIQLHLKNLKYHKNLHLIQRKQKFEIKIILQFLYQRFLQLMFNFFVIYIFSNIFFLMVKFFYINFFLKVICFYIIMP